MEYSKMTTQQIAEELCEVIRDGAASVSTVMHMIDEWKKDLQHHRDTTVGLWATDRPELIIDEKKLMFQITDVIPKDDLHPVFKEALRPFMPAKFPSHSEVFGEITRRDYFAAAAMSGILAGLASDVNGKYIVNDGYLHGGLVAKDALHCADELLKQLDYETI